MGLVEEGREQIVISTENGQREVPVQEGTPPALSDIVQAIEESLRNMSDLKPPFIVKFRWGNNEFPLAVASVEGETLKRVAMTALKNLMGFYAAYK